MEEENLVPVEGLEEHVRRSSSDLEIHGYESKDGADKHTYVVQYNPF